MANVSSIARPYALAAFDYAKEKQQLPAWKAFLDKAAHIADTPSVQHLLTNPQVSTEKMYDFFCDILASDVDPAKKNFLLLLSQNKRFSLLTRIVALFNNYYSALEKVSAVRVITAVEITEDFKQKLARALTKRIEQEVTLQCEVNPAILGGAIIHIGDNVIDGSVRGQLTRLLEFSLR